MSVRQQSNQILPQLDNCNMIANHWAGELLTIFEHTCVKEWKENQHLKVKMGEWKYNQHLRMNSEERPLIISSSYEILKEDDDYKSFAPDTLIFISTATANEANIFCWAERDKLLCAIKKNKNNFSIMSNYKDEIIRYRRFKKINLRLTEKGKFTKSSLGYQALNKTRSKGGKNSNQNSETQSIRKKGKPIKGSIVFINNGNNFEQKTMLGAYEIVRAEYSYEKSYSTFRKELKRSGGKPIDFKNKEVLTKLYLADNIEDISWWEE
jgi:hypothetical protein